MNENNDMLIVQPRKEGTQSEMWVEEQGATYGGIRQDVGRGTRGALWIREQRARFAKTRPCRCPTRARCGGQLACCESDTHLA
jgi:hypothetical protein